MSGSRPQRAYQLGIVSEVVAGDALRTAAAALAAKVALNSPAAMRATKKALWHSLEVGLTQARTDARDWRLRNHPDHARVRRGARTTRWQSLGTSPAAAESSSGRGPVGWIINNRPDRLNAYDALMREEFPRAWTELDHDPDVRVIVHTGNGRAFQTGADVEELDGDAVLQFPEPCAPWICG